MSIIDSIKNIFIPDKKEPFDWVDTAPSEYEPPDDWFADNKYAPAERRAELDAEVNAVEENPRPEEDMAEWFSDKKEHPDESDEIEEEKTMHQKMYEMATSKYNPFAVGGSESLGGGSEKINGTK